MASEIRVNQIQNRSGLSTVTFSDSGVVISGITTISDLRTSGNTIVAAGTTSAPSISPTGDSNTGIFFPSADTVAIAEGGVEALRVDSSGRLGVGITNPSTKLEIVGSYSSGAITTSFKISGSGWSLGGGPSLEFGQDPASYPTWVTGRIASTYSGSNWGGGLKFFYNNGTTSATLTEGMELTRSGNVEITNGNLVFSTAGKGIDFSATANSSGTMTSELLSDYEEGTWTITDQSGASLTFSVNYGHYTKVGRLVTFIGHVLYPSTANGSNSQLGGLPFNPISSNPGGADMGYGGCISFTDESTLETISVFSASNIQLGTLSGGRLTNSTLSGNRIEFFGQYYV